MIFIICFYTCCRLVRVQGKTLVEDSGGLPFRELFILLFFCWYIYCSCFGHQGALFLDYTYVHWTHMFMIVFLDYIHVYWSYILWMYVLLNLCMFVDVKYFQYWYVENECQEVLIGAI